MVLLYKWKSLADTYKQVYFLSESNFRPLLDFSRVTDISYNPPSASNLLFNVTGFFELTSTRSLFGICSFSLFFGIIS